MSDRLFIRGLQADCIIGRAEWERLVRQTVSIDLELPCDVRHAAGLDDVGPGVLNTKAISKHTSAFIEETSFQLLESLAEAVAGRLLETFPLSWVRLCVSKPGALRGTRTVGVDIRRRRVFISVGSNLEPDQNMAKARAWLSGSWSRVFESAAYGPPGQPDFQNAVASLVTGWSLSELRAWLRALEARAGRVRTEDKFAPRPLDLDVVLYGRFVSEDIFERPYVLVPMVELAPEFPIRRTTLAQLLAERPDFLSRVTGHHPPAAPGP